VKKRCQRNDFGSYAKTHETCRAPTYVAHLTQAAFWGILARVLGERATMSENTLPARTTSDQLEAGLQADLAKLTLDAEPQPLHVTARLRNYFLTGVVITGPIALTLYITWHIIDAIDIWVRPLLPVMHLPFPIPGLGLMVGIVSLTLIGAVAAHLFGRSLFSASEIMVARLPIIRNVYRGLHDIFTSVVAATGHNAPAHKVALVQFPSEGIWSLAFITGTAAVAVKETASDTDLISVFIPHGLLPPSGITCFVRRGDVKPLAMSVEDAARIIFSGGMAHAGDPASSD